MAYNQVRNSTSTVETVGGISTIVSQFGSITKQLLGGQSYNTSQDISNAILENLSLTQDQINPRTYELIRGIFEKYSDNSSLVEAYTLLALDAINKFGVRISDLVETTKNDTLQFTEVGIALLNHYRPATSQIARRKTNLELDTNKFVKRHIIA